MAFVRKPKPYTRGRGAVRFPSQGRVPFGRASFDWRWPETSGKPGAEKYRAGESRARSNGWLRPTPGPQRPEATQVGPAFRPLGQPAWFTALATLGGAVCLLVGGSLALNQVSREAQFQGMAQHLGQVLPQSVGEAQ